MSEESLREENRKLQKHIKEMQEKCEDVVGSIDWLNDMVPVATEAVAALNASGNNELAERLDIAINWGTADEKEFWHRLIATPNIKGAVLAGLEAAKGETNAQRMERLSERSELLRDLGRSVQSWRDDFLIPKYGNTDWKCPFVARIMELLSICEKALGDNLDVSVVKRKLFTAVVEAAQRLGAAWEALRLAKGQYEGLPVETKPRSMPQMHTPELWKSKIEAEDEAFAARKALVVAVKELDGAAV